MIRPTRRITLHGHLPDTPPNSARPSVATSVRTLEQQALAVAFPDGIPHGYDVRLHIHTRPSE
ncbi:hypothetical protein J2S53_001414 [Actinopolyspora lacussalsi]|nr:hypothetical protein [Actinopolyspora lacussalsi]